MSILCSLLFVFRSEGIGVGRANVVVESFRVSSEEWVVYYDHGSAIGVPEYLMELLALWVDFGLTSEGSLDRERSREMSRQTGGGNQPSREEGGTYG